MSQALAEVIKRLRKQAAEAQAGPAVHAAAGGQ
jgi:hypothetical protein